MCEGSLTIAAEKCQSAQNAAAQPNSLWVAQSGFSKTCISVSAVHPRPYTATVRPASDTCPTTLLNRLISDV